MVKKLIRPLEKPHAGVHRNRSHNRFGDIRRPGKAFTGKKFSPPADGRSVSRWNWFPSESDGCSLWCEPGLKGAGPIFIFEMDLTILPSHPTKSNNHFLMENFPSNFLSFSTMPVYSSSAMGSIAAPKKPWRRMSMAFSDTRVRTCSQKG